MSMLIAGVDDAGRGSAIGPLVIAGVLIREENLPELLALGVKDSKLLTPRRRELLSPRIRQISRSFEVVMLSPKEIDSVVLNGRKLRKLNWLEAKTMAKVIETLRPDMAYVDASDIVEQRFKQDILDCLPFKIPIVSEHKADRTYPVVSAASIIAKVERDREIAQIAEAYGNIGSGYPSDPKTLRFLQQLAEKAKEYPEFVRKSWKPVIRAKGEMGSTQAKLA